LRLDEPIKLDQRPGRVAIVVVEKSAFMKQLSLFKLLAAGLETVIRNGNPWWRGESIAELPPFRRWAFEPVYHA
jgi:hypothetical protein